MNTIFKRELHDWWSPVTRGQLTLTVFLMISLTACSSGPPGADKTNKAAAATTNTQAVTPASASSESPPKSLSSAGEYGENIYDYAKANDWKNADVKLAALRDAVKKVRSDLKNQNTAVDHLDANVAVLDRAVTAKDRQAAMREANQVTLNIANMTTAYKLSVPVEVTRLDYYGRELEVWAEAQDTNELQTTAREIRREWDSLRPSVEVHKAAEAKKFDALVAQV